MHVLQCVHHPNSSYGQLVFTLREFRSGMCLQEEHLSTARPDAWPHRASWDCLGIVACRLWRVGVGCCLLISTCASNGERLCQVHCRLVMVFCMRDITSGECIGGIALQEYTRT
jgi:hypothetical protein